MQLINKIDGTTINSRFDPSLSLGQMKPVAPTYNPSNPSFTQITIRSFTLTHASRSGKKETPINQWSHVAFPHPVLNSDLSSGATELLSIISTVVKNQGRFYMSVGKVADILGVQYDTAKRYLWSLRQELIQQGVGVKGVDDIEGIDNEGKELNLDSQLELTGESTEDILPNDIFTLYIKQKGIGVIDAEESTALMMPLNIYRLRLPLSKRLILTKLYNVGQPCIRRSNHLIWKELQMKGATFRRNLREMIDQGLLDTVEETLGSGFVLKSVIISHPLLLELDAEQSYLERCITLPKNNENLKAVNYQGFTILEKASIPSDKRTIHPENVQSILKSVHLVHHIKEVLKRILKRVLKNFYRPSKNSESLMIIFHDNKQSKITDDVIHRFVERLSLDFLAENLIAYLDSQKHPADDLKETTLAAISRQLLCRTVYDRLVGCLAGSVMPEGGASLERLREGVRDLTHRQSEALFEVFITTPIHLSVTPITCNTTAIPSPVHPSIETPMKLPRSNTVQPTHDLEADVFQTESYQPDLFDSTPTKPVSRTPRQFGATAIDRAIETAKHRSSLAQQRQVEKALSRSRRSSKSAPAKKKIPLKGVSWAMFNESAKLGYQELTQTSESLSFKLQELRNHPKDRGRLKNAVNHLGITPELFLQLVQWAASHWPILTTGDGAIAYRHNVDKLMFQPYIFLTFTHLRDIHNDWLNSQLKPLQQAQKVDVVKYGTAQPEFEVVPQAELNSLSAHDKAKTFKAPRIGSQPRETLRVKNSSFDKVAKPRHSQMSFTKKKDWFSQNIAKVSAVSLDEFKINQFDKIYQKLVLLYGQRGCDMVMSVWGTSDNRSPDQGLTVAQIMDCDQQLTTPAICQRYNEKYGYDLFGGTFQGSPHAWIIPEDRRERVIKSYLDSKR